MAEHWSETILWKTIRDTSDAAASGVVSLLTRRMPEIQTVLASGATSPTDFTLHDAGHSFRVAQRMAEIIPPDVLPQLSLYELALLLLSAYLHDIGMTPDQRKVTLHYRFLLVGVDAGGLSDQEISDLQHWLDDNERSIPLPISTDRPTTEVLRLANELTTYYCRHRHNHWGAEWTRSHFVGEAMGTYSGWLDDLIRLCQSHHWGKGALLEQVFDPRAVGSPAVIVHLRYLACVLRVADILEFDPERTPDVILRHRDIAAGSLIYWYKDHEVSMVMEGNRLVFFARPSSATAHRAIEVMLDAIDCELQVCRSLGAETQFQHCPGLVNPLPHRWDLEPSAHRDIQPKNGAYEYIDGAFRPNTHKLLELLSGNALYGSPLVAVRELLQNAFDAVREQMAYERLARPNPMAPGLEGSLGKAHRVELRLEPRADGAWLVCADTGVGMTRTIIADHLLVSGQSRRHDVLELERRCEQAGFKLGRTGQFGIGVLSYFMLADRLQFATRRSVDPGDSDGIGWYFETEGVGSFGELRRDSSVSRGSRVELHLRHEVYEDFAQLFRDLREYVRNTVTFAPCDLAVNSPVPGCATLSIDPGWTVDRQAVVVGAVRRSLERHPYRTHETPLELLPAQSRRDLKLQEEERNKVADSAARCLKVAEYSGSLPHQMGRYRLTLPYFDLSHGASLGFLRIQSANNALFLRPVLSGYMVTPILDAQMSWKGMRIGSDYDHLFTYRGSPGEPPVLMEVEFQDREAGAESVARHTIILSRSGVDCVKWVRDQAWSLVDEFLENNAASAFATLNRRIARRGNAINAPPNWLALARRNGEEAKTWQRVSFPATTSLIWAYMPALPPSVTWKGKPVNVVPCLGGPEDDDHYDGVAWINVHDAPDRIVMVRHYRPLVAPLWTKNPLGRAITNREALLTGSFAMAWRGICGARFESYAALREGATVWNRHHSLVSLVSSDSWAWAEEVLDRRSDPLALADVLTSDRKRAAAWLLGVIDRGLNEIWLGFYEREATIVNAVWRLLFGNSGRSVRVRFWVQAAVDARLRIVAPGQWDIHRKPEELASSMPDPGEEWWLETTSVSIDAQHTRAIASSAMVAAASAKVIKRARGRRGSTRRHGKS